MHYYFSRFHILNLHPFPAWCLNSSGFWLFPHQAISLHFFSIKIINLFFISRGLAWDYKTTISQATGTICFIPLHSHNYVAFWPYETRVCLASLFIIFSIQAAAVHSAAWLITGLQNCMCFTKNWHNFALQPLVHVFPIETRVSPLKKRAPHYRMAILWQFAEKLAWWSQP